MQETETKLETEEREAKWSGPKGKRGLLLRMGIAAACLALALCACAADPEQPGPGTEPVSPESEEPEPDTTPPELLGVKDITVLMGETISYRDGVSAVDNVDGTVPFQVDASGVNLAVPGAYQVVYSAKDAAGNRAEAAATVTVEEDIQGPDDEPTSAGDGDVQESDGPAPSSSGSVSTSQATEEEVNRLADQILSRILRDGMSQREQARAIYNYVYNHIRYTGSSDKSSWIVGAYMGFTRQRGDCYNYFACSKALLTRAGIPNIDLERVGGTTRHYWQLVNVGDGWYHFDACWKPTGYPLSGFLITETQARTYTQRLNDAGVRKNYYVYDYDSCPVEVEGTPPEGWRPPAYTPPPVVTQPPVESEEPPVETEEPPEVTDEPPEETGEPPEETPFPGETEPPVETGELPPEWTEPPEESEPEPVDDWENWPGGA